MTSIDIKTFVLEAFDTLFNKRDYEAAAKFWSPNYIQHSAHIAPGRDGLFNLVRALPAGLRYENHVVVADGEYILAHGRFSGHGRPRSWIAADILRIADGVFAEHWDVLQDEATEEESVSGLPMFGASFAEPVPITDASLSIGQARLIVAPFYDALNQPAQKDVDALLDQSAHPDYHSYHTNEEWITRDQLAGIFKGMGAAVPDLRWEIKDIHVVGDQIIVRGAATGTPTGEFWGARPTGKSFNTMALDIFTVRDGKLASCYHVENWMTALQQIGK